jgi:hypothetical protein
MTTKISGSSRIYLKKSRRRSRRRYERFRPKELAGSGRQVLQQTQRQQAAAPSP